MHELGLVTELLSLVNGAAEQNHAKSVKSIRVKIGAYSGVVPELIEECFAPASTGTLSEGAVLHFEPVPVTVACLDCKKTGTMEDHSFTCPFCGSENIRMLTGREFFIDSIEVE